MRGIPQVFGSPADWKNAYAYAKASTDPEVKYEMVSRLAALKETKQCLVPKAGLKKKPEDMTAADFEYVDDPAGAFATCGLAEAEIDAMVAGLE